MIFEADYDKIELQNIVMTSFQWRHHYYVTEKTSQIFSNLGPSQSKFLATPVQWEVIEWKRIVVSLVSLYFEQFGNSYPEIFKNSYIKTNNNGDKKPCSLAGLISPIKSTATLLKGTSREA